MDYRWDEEQARACTSDLEELVYLSNLVGGDSALTQPGGGNSSVKRIEEDVFGRTVDVLRVKGSGTDMASIGPSGFAGLRLPDLGALRSRERMSDEDMMTFLRAAMLDTREPGPSVETPLHAMLPFRFIVHTHDFTSQALTDTPEPEALVREALDGEAAYIDYVRPGFPLARAVARLGVSDNALADARGLVLGRHGLVAWGDTAKQCYDNLHLLVTRAEKFVEARRAKAGVGRSVFADLEAPVPPVERRRAIARAILPIIRARLARESPVILHHDASDEAVTFAGARRAAEVAARGMVTPEHILRCGRLPLYVGASFAEASPAEAERAIDDAVDRYTREADEAFGRAGPANERAPAAPRVLILPGLGIVTAMKDKQNAVIGNICYRHAIRVMDAAEALGGFRFLEERDALEFEHWPLELIKLKAPERELSRQVALITGAASGIGRATAERFAAEGAHVVLTDIDRARLIEVEQRIAAACKDPHRVRIVEADAASAADTARAVDEAVLTFGGVDVLVANAGFVQASPLDELGEEDWARHFDVNVKSCFLAARQVIPIMKRAGRGAIVFNASKAAFAPTVDNAAYASSKAAVGALTRNLATELGPFGIRVNAFNADFVDTPLMRALIEQRAARSGITPESQAATYRSRNLLRVGPIPPAAVAETALFLASARSRFTTGAAIPVDGGIKEAMPR